VTDKKGETKMTATTTRTFGIELEIVGISSEAAVAALVAAGKFQTRTLNLLTIGHTHEYVDLAFGVLLAQVRQRHRMQCPPELATIITIEMAEWAAKRGEVCHCTVLQRIYDFATWFEPQGVRIHKCWMTRQGIDAPHSFA
jgi:hypothetical protein